MKYSLPGTPAADETCMQSAEDAGSPPETGRGPADPPPPGPGGVFYSQTLRLSEGGPQQPGQGVGVRHPQSRLSICARHQWSQHSRLPLLGLGQTGKSARQPTGPDLDECCSPPTKTSSQNTGQAARPPDWLSHSHSRRQMGAWP